MKFNRVYVASIFLNMLHMFLVLILFIGCIGGSKSRAPASVESAKKQSTQDSVTNGPIEYTDQSELLIIEDESQYTLGVRGETAEEVERLSLQNSVPLDIKMISISGKGIGIKSETLPSRFDNSTSVAFPPIISQESVGACYAMSTTYYTASFELCSKTPNCDNSDPLSDNAIVLSPRWTHSLVARSNHQDGSSFSTAVDISRFFGGVLFKDLPFDSEFLRNPSADLKVLPSLDVMQRGLKYKVKSIGSISGLNGSWLDSASTVNEDGVKKLKQMLANGKLASFQTPVFSWRSGKLAYPNGVSGQTEHAVTHICGGAGMHQMTVVGYDDNIWVDVNRNGIEDSGEKGAFKIANSWGESWGNRGFTWSAYDAYRPVSAVPVVANGNEHDCSNERADTLLGGLSAAKRVPLTYAWDFLQAMFNSDNEKTYDAKVVAEITFLKEQNANVRFNFNFKNTSDRLGQNQNFQFRDFLTTPGISDTTSVLIDLTSLMHEGVNTFEMYMSMPQDILSQFSQGSLLLNRQIKSVRVLNEQDGSVLYTKSYNTDALGLSECQLNMLTCEKITFSFNADEIFDDDQTYACQGFNPMNASLCSGDEQDLISNFDKTIVTSCSAAQKCEYTCNSGYSLDSVTHLCKQQVAPVVYSCKGTLPLNATICTGDDSALTANVNNALVAACTNAVKCEYICKAGFSFDSVSKTCKQVSAPVYTCSGAAPVYATLCSGDNTGLTSATARSLVSSCTADKKCEYACNTGYFLDSSTNTCKRNPVYACLGVAPSYATLCSGDGTGLTSSVNRLAVSSCTNAVKCEYICNSGYYFDSATKICKKNPVYACLGVAPSYATLCSGDSVGLTSSVNRLAVSSCTDAVKCEYTCNSGYLLDSVSKTCKIIPTTVVPTVPVIQPIAPVTPEVPATPPVQVLPSNDPYLAADAQIYLDNKVRHANALFFNQKRNWTKTEIIQGMKIANYATPAAHYSQHSNEGIPYSTPWSITTDSDKAHVYWIRKANSLNGNKQAGSQTWSNPEVQSGAAMSACDHFIAYGKNEVYTSENGDKLVLPNPCNSGARCGALPGYASVSAADGEFKTFFRERNGSSVYCIRRMCTNGIWSAENILQNPSVTGSCDYSNEQTSDPYVAADAQIYLDNKVKHVNALFYKQKRVWTKSDVIQGMKSLGFSSPALHYAQYQSEGIPYSTPWSIINDSSKEHVYWIRKANSLNKDRYNGLTDWINTNVKSSAGMSACDHFKSYGKNEYYMSEAGDLLPLPDPCDVSR